MIGNYNYTLFENIVERDGLAEKLPTLHFVDTDDEDGWFDDYISTFDGE